MPRNSKPRTKTKAKATKAKAKPILRVLDAGSSDSDQSSNNDSSSASVDRSVHGHGHGRRQHGAQSAHSVHTLKDDEIIFIAPGDVVLMETDLKNIRDLLAPILDKAQDPANRYDRLLEDVRGARHGCDPVAFARVFFRMMALPFNLTKDPNPFAKRLSAFYIHAVNEIDEGPEYPTEFQKATLRCCIKHWSDERKHVRERIIEVIIHILRKIGKNNISNIKDDTSLKIQEVFMKGLGDKHHKVRSLCAGGIQYFVPLEYEPGLELFEVLEFSLRQDPFHEVRRSALLSMRFGTENSELLFEKVIDNHEIVRQMAFILIKRDNLLDGMELGMREAIVQAGLNDAKASVRSAAISALKDFLENKCSNDITNLLSRFDSYQKKTLCFKILDTLIPSSSDVAKYDTTFLINGLIPYEKISEENLFFWLFLISRRPSTIKIPTVSEMCEYLLEYKKLVERQTSESYHCEYLNELFAVLKLLSVEEGGRRMIRGLVRDFNGFKHLEVENIPYLIRLLYHSSPPNLEESLAELLQQFLDSFGVTKQPTPAPVIVPTPGQNVQQELTKLKTEVGLLVLQRHRKLNDMNTASQSLDFTKAQLLKNELDVLSQKLDSLKSQVSELENEALASAPLNDSTVAESDDENEEERRSSVQPTVRSLQLSFSALVYHLKSTKQKPSSYTRAFLDMHFDNGFLHDNALVRKLTLEARTMFGLSDFEDAEKTIFTCIQAFYVDPEKDVRITAYKCIIDILLMYGFSRFGSDSIENLISKKMHAPMSLDTTISLESKTGNSALSDSTTMLKTLVLSTLTSDDDTMLHIAIEGAMKLLLARRIRSPRMISKLMLMWVNPAYETKQVVRDINVFMPIYVRQGVIESSTVINCIPDCIRKIIYAPANSSFQLNPTQCSEDLLRLVATCTQQGKLEGHYDNPIAPHDALIGIILDGIKHHESLEEMEVYIKSLKYINIDNAPGIRIKELSKQLRRITRKIVVPANFRLSVATFTRYLDRLQADALAKEIHNKAAGSPGSSRSRTLNATSSSSAPHRSQISVLDSTKSSDAKERMSESDEHCEVDFDD